MLRVIDSATLRIISPPPPVLVEAVIVLGVPEEILLSRTELASIKILPAFPCPGKALPLLEKLLALIVAPSWIFKLLVAILIFPPSPVLAIALPKMPLAPNSEPPINSTVSAVIFNSPPSPEPAVLTAICAPSVTFKLLVLIPKLPIEKTAQNYETGYYL
ncbi:MAG: hypothetical protein QNJ41_13785 [Xenococcaceae cyanobacterium MO_188.B32]|nr:hypothetical protein [Xenococcaceae cyanobacterium MO_188.B32]